MRDFRQCRRLRNSHSHRRRGCRLRAQHVEGDIRRSFAGEVRSAAGPAVFGHAAQRVQRPAICRPAYGAGSVRARVQCRGDKKVG